MKIGYLKTRTTRAGLSGRKIITRRSPAVIDEIHCGYDHPVGICPKCRQGHGLKIALSQPPLLTP